MTRQPDLKLPTTVSVTSPARESVSRPA